MTKKKEENKEKDSKSKGRFMYESDKGLSVVSKAKHINKEEKPEKGNKDEK